LALPTLYEPASGLLAAEHGRRVVEGFPSGIVEGGVIVDVVVEPDGLLAGYLL
jgi:hypothetical protein